MRRKKPLARKKHIRRNPAQPRALNREKPYMTPPFNWKLQVCARAPRAQGKRVCPICREPPTAENPLQGHHVIAKQKLKSHAKSVAHDAHMTEQEALALVEKLLWDVRNGLPICERCHDRHTKGVRRIPYGALRPCHFEFAAELKLDWYLDRYYPHDDSGSTRTAVGVTPSG